MDSPNIQKPEYKIYDIIKNAKNWDICPEFNFRDPIIDPIFLSNSLQMTIEENKGVALAAPQIGINTRVIFIKGFEGALFNPKIVQMGDEQETHVEVSLSYPDLMVMIKRPDVIRVRYANFLGEVTSNTFMGLTSRTIQRKMSFLDGQLFYRAANKYHREQAFKKRGKNVHVS